MKLNLTESQIAQSPAATEIEKIKETMYTLHDKLQSSQQHNITLDSHSNTYNK
jgi:hypothetical protein